jgi:hypothetical protein
MKIDGEPSDPTAQAEAPLTDADSARSADNIRLWTSYLPVDCVNTMIKMGWDLTV